METTWLRLRRVRKKGARGEPEGVLLASLKDVAAPKAKAAPAADPTYYFHFDHLGTPQAMTDANRQVVWAASYEPFGKVHIETELVLNNHRLPGQTEDRESGLSYNKWRNYRASLGRYAEPDPLFLPSFAAQPETGFNAEFSALLRSPGLLSTRTVQGLNLYLYAYNSPTLLADPLGLLAGCFRVSAGGVGAAIFGYGASCSVMLCYDSEGGVTFRKSCTVCPMCIGMGGAAGITAGACIADKPADLCGLSGLGYAGMGPVAVVQVQVFESGGACVSTGIPGLAAGAGVGGCGCYTKSF